MGLHCFKHIDTDAMFKRHISRFLSTLVLIISAWSAQAADVNAGKALFVNNCASCHAKNMKAKLTGPALAGTQERWAAYPKADLYQWIRNSQSMVNTHPRGKELWAEYKPTVMTSFPNLKDEDIDNILAYIDDVVAQSAKTTTGGPDPGVAAAEPEKNNLPLYAGVAALLGLLAFVLSRILSNLRQLTALQAGEVPVQQKSIWQQLTSRSVVGFAIFALVVLGGYTTVNNAIALGRQQGYQPEQPIKFSHATHAGLQKIDCQYCHDSARKSKHSAIPATNTCMNCHKAIKVGSQNGTEELTKIYVSAGYDPNTDKYVENYNSMSMKDVAAIYKKWIAAQAKELNADMTITDAAATAERQWINIEQSLTNEKKKDPRGPIEWKRIHNLPDHAYFNHAQHVAVGKVECQQCHGPVETMEVLKQYAPLSMGWCINCHRETEVKFADNPYYDSYERYHKELKAGTRSKVTVADIGGLECQKCHY
jgi:mono/diheme cytochrome c family protein